MQLGRLGEAHSSPAANHRAPPAWLSSGVAADSPMSRAIRHKHPLTTGLDEPVRGRSRWRVFTTTRRKCHHALNRDFPLHVLLWSSVTIPDLLRPARHNPSPILSIRQAFSVSTLTDRGQVSYLWSQMSILLQIGESLILFASLPLWHITLLGRHAACLNNVHILGLGSFKLYRSTILLICQVLQLMWKTTSSTCYPSWFSSFLHHQPLQPYHEVHLYPCTCRSRRGSGLSSLHRPIPYHQPA